MVYVDGRVEEASTYVTKGIIRTASAWSIEEDGVRERGRRGINKRKETD